MQRSNAIGKFELSKWASAVDCVALEQIEFGPSELAQLRVAQSQAKRTANKRRVHLGRN